MLTEEEKKHRHRIADQKWAKANLNKRSDYAKKRYATKKIKILANNARWRKNNPDKAVALVRKWQKANPDRVLTSMQKWRTANPDAAKTATRRWAKANPGRVRFYAAQRRARKLQATPKWLTKEQLEEMKQFYINCPEGYEVDHIYPLRGKFSCGLHVPWNLQYLLAKENHKKGNRVF
jgi:hypothetical protein